MLDSILLGIAKAAILSQFDDEKGIDKEALLKSYPYLKEDGAVFVTLKHEHDLRGCIGSLVAHRTLYDDIIHNAISAGFSDPRFESLTKEELSYLTLEVSLLSKPELLEYQDYEDLLHKVKPNVDGLILKHGVYQGTFLPQVWEQLPTPKLFLKHLSMKASAYPSIYEEHPSIYRYRVDAIEERFDEILPL